jgi:hypothetical protein
MAAKRVSGCCLRSNRRTHNTMAAKRVSGCCWRSSRRTIVCSSIWP